VKRIRGKERNWDPRNEGVGISKEMGRRDSEKFKEFPALPKGPQKPPEGRNVGESEGLKERSKGQTRSIKRGVATITKREGNPLVKKNSLDEKQTN